MKIRTATVDDAHMLMEQCKHVQQVHIEGRPDIFKHFDEVAMVQFMVDQIMSPQVKIFIGEMDDEVVGYTLARVIHRDDSLFKHPVRRIEIDQISVLPEHRGKGYGEVLTTYVVEYAKSEQIEQITLGVWAFNKSAIRFYERLGFSVRYTNMEIII